ncbi:MAG: DNA methylase [Eubacterium sp.]|nr:DNA methylase [Eubacterium sp.]
MSETDKRQSYFIAIDLKSFYASVECVERGLDPLTTNLVVADVSRTEKTICLAVSPSLKAYGISGRARLFEVVERVKAINYMRRMEAGGSFTGESTDDTDLKADPSLKLSYIAAPPNMALYLDYSARVYSVYLRYIAPEDIHIYSVDEVFIDVTGYLKVYNSTPHELARRIVSDILEETGVTATAGIGTNLYLAKIAMDVWAKHIPADEDGVRIAELDEISYRRNLWTHKPITDFWRVGRGYAKKLSDAGLYTMGDVARCSLGGPGEFHNEELLYKMFGVNAELLIDHAWGYEPCTMVDIKSYKPKTESLSQGQVLSEAYTARKGRLIVWEMTDLLVLDLVDKGLVTDQVVLDVGYDIENLTDPERRRAYKGKVVTDGYGRRVPAPAHGSANLDPATSSSEKILDAVTSLYDRIVDDDLLVRRFTITVAHLQSGEEAEENPKYAQLDIFTDYAVKIDDTHAKEEEERRLEREKKMQEAVISIKKRYGKNAVLKGANLVEGAKTIERNGQIGGHKA